MDRRPARCFSGRVPLLSAIAVGVVCAGVVGQLWAEATGRARARAIFKVAASFGFVVLAAPFARGRYGALVLAGLCLSAVGDALLLSPAKRAFLSGLVAFLLTHLAYAAAFAPGSRVSPLAAAILFCMGAAVVAWLWPGLGTMRVPVLVYTAAISSMLLFGLGVESPLVPIGAVLFYLSDLTVARDRFVHPGLANRVVGLPMYYAAQVILALSARVRIP